MTDSASLGLALFISDGSGVSAEAFGEALLCQFPDQSFERDRIAFCHGPDQAREAGRMAARASLAGRRVIVFSTLAEPSTRAALFEAFPSAIDLYAHMLPSAERSLGLRARVAIGQSHGARARSSREARAAAIEFALSHDDGAHKSYGEADLILVGVSRSGKTPCCMWLAMHYGLKAANYPLAPEDFQGERDVWPKALAGLESRCAGLTIDPERLSQIRQARLPGSRYASLEACRFEVAAAERLMRSKSLAVIDSTERGVEEMCAALVQKLKLHPPMAY